MQHWISRGQLFLLFFAGLLLGRAGLLTATIVALATIPLAMITGTLPALLIAGALVFLAGLAAFLNGGHLLPW
jgi:hypothetical protein